MRKHYNYEGVVGGKKGIKAGSVHTAVAGKRAGQPGGIVAVRIGRVVQAINKAVVTARRRASIQAGNLRRCKSNPEKIK